MDKGLKLLLSIYWSGGIWNYAPPTEEDFKQAIREGNKSEVEVLLGILGICGVLSSKDAPCYCDRFVNVYDRSPIEHTNDYAYPINRWHASDGVNEDRFEKVFGFRYADL